jgi:hypothetical protein
MKRFVFSSVFDDELGTTSTLDIWIAPTSNFLSYQCTTHQRHLTNALPVSGFKHRNQAFNGLIVRVVYSEGECALGIRTSYRLVDCALI